MSFTHGMNIEEVRAQAEAVGGIYDSNTESRGGANDTITDFTDNDWWGDDATNFSSSWFETVDAHYQTVSDTLDQIKTDIATQADEQEETSGR